MLPQQTLVTLREMRLAGMADAYEGQLRDADAQQLSFDERFGLLADQEWSRRQSRRLARRLQEAKLPLNATVEDIDYTVPRGLDRALIRTLAQGRWIQEHLPALITGPAGVGKTYVASALGHAACRQGYTARYFRVSRLLAALGIAKADGSYPRLLARLAKTDVLILDEWGLVPMSVGDTRELLDVIDDRYLRRSTIIASQLPVDAWHGTIPDPSLGDALLDRIVHAAHRIALHGESMRKLRAAKAS